MEVSRPTVQWVVAAVSAVALACALVLVGLKYDNDRQHEADERVAAQAKGALEARISSAGNELSILASAVQSTNGDSAAFNDAAKGLLRDEAVSAVSYTVAVDDDDRRAFEREAGFPIRQIGEDGELVPAERQDVYYVIKEITPVRPTSGFGVNVGANPDRREALDEAAATGRPTLTRPLNLIANGRRGALVYAPVYETSGSIAGFAVGVYDLELLAGEIVELLPDGAEFSVSDRGDSVAGMVAMADAATAELDVAGRTWDLAATSASASGLPLAVVLPAVGGTMAAILIGVITSARRRERYAELLVGRRMDERDRAEAERERAEEEFNATFDESPVGIAIIALDGRLTAVNRSLCTLLGKSKTQLEELNTQSLMSDDDLREARRAGALMTAGEMRSYKDEIILPGPAGLKLWAQVNSVLIRDSAGEPLHFLAHVEDSTQNHRERERLRKLAELDELTGLLNRRGFTRALEQKLSECERYERTGALLVLDLDGLKAVNDQHGHGAGDVMLLAAATALRDGTRSSDIVGRVGGDEFAIIVPAGGEEEARLAGENVLARLAREKRPADQRQLSASIGVVAFSDLTVLSVESAMSAADLAMYEAKRAGGQRLALWDD